MEHRATSLSLRRIASIIALVLLAAFIAYLAVRLAHVLLIVFCGLLGAVFLGGVARRVQAVTGLQRAWALGSVLLALGGLASGIVLYTGPDLVRQVTQLINQLPAALTRLQALLDQYPWSTAWFGSSGVSALLPAASNVVQSVTNVFSTTLGVLTNVFIISAVSIYGALRPSAYVENTVMLVPPAHRERARTVLHALGRALRWWMAGRFVMMAVVAVFTSTGLWLIGVPSPLALGLIAGAADIVPYIGPIVGAIPGLLVGLLAGPETLLAVALLYGVVQLLESYLLNPVIQERAVSLLPAVLISAQVMLGVLAGPLGVLLATPLAVCIIVLVQMLYVEDVLGDTVHVLGDHKPANR